MNNYQKSLLVSILLSAHACSQQIKNPVVGQDPNADSKPKEEELSFPLVVEGDNEFRIEQITNIKTLEKSLDESPTFVLNRDFCEQMMEVKKLPKGSLNFSSDIYESISPDSETWDFKAKLAEVSIEVSPKSLTQIDYKVHKYFLTKVDSTENPGTKVIKRLKQGIVTFSCFVPNSWTVMSSALGVSSTTPTQPRKHCFKYEQIGVKKGTCIDEIAFSSGFVKTKTMVSAYLPEESTTELFPLLVLDSERVRDQIRKLFVERFPRFGNQNLEIQTKYSLKSLGDDNFVRAVAISSEKSLESVPDWFVLEKTNAKYLKQQAKGRSVISFKEALSLDNVKTDSELAKIFENFRNKGERLDLGSRFFSYFQNNREFVGPPSVVDKHKGIAIDKAFGLLEQGDFNIYMIVETLDDARLLFVFRGSKGNLGQIVEVRAMSPDEENNLPQLN